MAWLSTIFLAFLYVALIAFGWYPCCCGYTQCPFVPSTRPPLLDYIAVTDGVCACGINGATGQIAFQSVSGPTATYASTNFPDCDGGPDQTISFFCSTPVAGVPATNMAISLFLGTHCAVANPASIFTVLLDLVSIQYDPLEAVFLGRLFDGGLFSCPCVGQLITITVTEP